MNHDTPLAAGPARTALQEQLLGLASRPTALDAFRRARRAFLGGQHVDMGRLSQDLGINLTSGLYIDGYKGTDPIHDGHAKETENRTSAKREWAKQFNKGEGF